MRRSTLWILPILAACLGAAPSHAGPPLDSDMDGIPDVLDVCSMDALSPVPCGDDNNDGYGNRCDGDFNNDGVINATDSGLYLPDLASMADSGIGTDMNCDGVVGSTDSGLYLWQLIDTVPGPSGLPCAGTVPCPPPSATSAQLTLLGLGLERVAGGPPLDSDSDGTPDVLDVCLLDPLSPVPCGDDDNDGYGNRCDGDFNNDGVVGSTDAGLYLPDLASMADSGIGTDMNCDGVVNSTDSGLYLRQISSMSPGPSGLPCAGTIPCP